MPPSSSFGSWYDEQKAAENGDAMQSSSSWFSVDSEQMLPLFSSENLQGFSFESMKQSMEAQMPKKIMGMGYQQRFKVRPLCSSPDSLAFSTPWLDRLSPPANQLFLLQYLLDPEIDNKLYPSGILCSALLVGTLFRPSLLCGSSYASIEAPEVCT